MDFTESLREKDQVNQALQADNNDLQIKNNMLEAKIAEIQIKNAAIQKKHEAVIKKLHKRLDQYEEAYKQLKFQLAQLQRHRFGKRSERDKAPSDEDEPAEGDTLQVATHKRRKQKPRDTSHLPRVIEIIAIPEEEKRCHCGCEKIVLRYEVKELFDYVPAIFQIIEQRREVVACPKGCEGEIKTAPVPLQILPKIKATEGLLAHIIVANNL